MNRKYFLPGFGALLAALTVFAVVRSNAKPAAGPEKSKVIAVRSVLAMAKAVPVTLHANGNVVPIDTVEVRPRTQNMVREVLKQEGADVRAGELLFILDERSDNSNSEKVQGDIARDMAQLQEAEADLKRNLDLFNKHFVAQAVVDGAKSRAAALRAALKTDNALLKSSEISLDHNRIRASISGRLGAINVHPGSLVQPGGAPLVTISRLDTVAVSFTLPERELGHILASFPAHEVVVQAELADQRLVPGKLIFVDNQVDMQTGTIRMKARFDNPGRSMWPGAFANIRLVSHTLNNAVVVPAQALVSGVNSGATGSSLPGADGRSLFVIGPDNQVSLQRVEVLHIEAGEAAVQGLKPGSRVVVDGVSNLRAGSKVKEAPAT